jgi:hypothetical protein
MAELASEQHRKPIDERSCCRPLDLRPTSLVGSWNLGPTHQGAGQTQICSQPQRGDASASACRADSFKIADEVIV